MIAARLRSRGWRELMSEGAPAAAWSTAGRLYAVLPSTLCLCDVTVFAL